jgi:hypothetical protein
VGIIVMLIALAGCARARGRDDERRDLTCRCPNAAVVDTTLLAFLSKASAAHHQADLALERKDDAAAIAALDAVCKEPWPSNTPEAREVVADTRARLSEVRSAGGDFEGALGDVAEGLTLADSPTHFQGHLLEMRGIVLERQANALAAHGDILGAERAKSSAVAAFGAAIEVQDLVIERALGDAGRR